jgi:rsbT antagonist protein RsbS
MSDRQISIIGLWDVLLVPLQGDISDQHTNQLSEEVLEQICKRNSRGLVVDVSGVALIDSHLCAAIGKLASAARLMGCQSFVSGLSAEVAMTLESMGFSFDRIETTRGLEDALARFDVGRLAHADDADAEWSEEEAL